MATESGVRKFIQKGSSGSPVETRQCARISPNEAADCRRSLNVFRHFTHGTSPSCKETPFYVSTSQGSPLNAPRAIRNECSDIDVTEDYSAAFMLGRWILHIMSLLSSSQPERLTSLTTPVPNDALSSKQLQIEFNYSIILDHSQEFPKPFVKTIFRPFQTKN